MAHLVTAKSLRLLIKPPTPQHSHLAEGDTECHWRPMLTPSAMLQAAELWADQATFMALSAGYSALSLVRPNTVYQGLTYLLHMVVGSSTDWNQHSSAQSQNMVLLMRKSIVISLSRDGLVPGESESTNLDEALFGFQLFPRHYLHHGRRTRTVV